jgi:putative endonuclease
VYYVYVLENRNSEFYTGYCSDLRKRLREHKSGKVFATKAKLPIELIYYEACLDKYDAVKREKYLKSGPGKRYLK